MNLKRLLVALEQIKATAPHLLEQDIILIDDQVYDLVLINVYGDDRIAFMKDFKWEGHSDGRTVDASEAD